MRVSILALTCGRLDYTKKTWNLNLVDASCPIYWWDNGSDQELREFCMSHRPDYVYLSDTNEGISNPLNHLMQKAFEDGADMVITMANDIIEPPKWIQLRVNAMHEIPTAGIIAIAPTGQVIRYPRKLTNGISWESGDVIGNFGITKKLFDAVGLLFDEFGIYGPIDLEYCARARAAGFDTIYLSDYTAQHIGASTGSEYDKAKATSLHNSWSKYHEQLQRIHGGKTEYWSDHT